MVELEAGDMAEQDPMSMQRALRRPRRSRRVDHHRRIIRHRIGGGKTVHWRLRKRGKTDPVLPFAIHQHNRFQIRQLPADRCNLFITETIGDNSHGTRIAQPVFKRFDAEEQRQRQRDGTQLVNARMRDCRLETLRQKDRHAISGPDTLIQKSLRKSGGLCRKSPIGQRQMRAIGAEMLQADTIRIALCPGIADSHADVEFVRNLPTEIAAEIVIGIADRKHVPAARNVAAAHLTLPAKEIQPKLAER